MGGDDDDGFGFYLLSDFVADGLQFGVGWVGVIFEEVGASWGGISVLCLGGSGWLDVRGVAYRARGNRREFVACW